VGKRKCEFVKKIFGLSFSTKKKIQRKFFQSGKEFAKNSMKENFEKGVCTKFP